MAYVPQARKALIAAELKKVVPADWKYSLAVRNHSTIVFTLRQGPIELPANISPYRPEHLAEYNVSAETMAIFVAIFDALNLRGTEGANYDNSDVQTDYFDVGWYVDVNIGRWDSPYLHVLPVAKTVAQKAPTCARKAKPTRAEVSALPGFDAALYATMSPGKKAAYTKSLQAQTI